MQHYRCKCGDKTMMSSMGTKDCQGCEDCKTTFAQHPDYHKELQPHKWGVKYNQNTGKPYKRCKRCGELDVKSYKEASKQELKT